ncbi:hypothetical protein [Geobacter sp. SVR]|uniref:hypothetical protein n=1 Tax=Geobacter sp. SVR TaxID=2495594 RepID=UPI00143F012A|nr:hypothetical protein [Geobacter sp. SVR]BCS54602.1 hypothetical protein GSVR_29100 [Geobacter sp. SVR]GCF86891.1 hypothetical protein GSbR_34910 [Geobacter sp. SVR]
MDIVNVAGAAQMMKISQTRQVLATTLMKQAADQQSQIATLLEQNAQQQSPPTGDPEFSFSTYA